MYFKHLFPALLCLVGTQAFAQKLPAVQKPSLRSPSNAKVDGKAAEWGDFQAYNHATDVYYTMANDDKKLYLVIQATYPDVIKKILNAGITFTVNKLGKKNDPQNMAFTYPAFDKSNIQFVVVFKDQPKIVAGDNSTVLAADSFMNANNKRMHDKAKMIRTAGVKNLDTLISVYNEEGINVAASFDNKMVYTWEMSIDLKYLPVTNINTHFNYQVMINEVVEHGIDIKKDADGTILSVNIQKGAQQGQPATYFWGEYTLAKK